MTNITHATLEMHLTMQGQASLRRVWILNPRLSLKCILQCIIKLSSQTSQHANVSYPLESTILNPKLSL
ncbi:hypothetical protein H5410_050870 [Solanum commersonii]|uniref:Non-structural protein NS-S n=1 Tax=Solanum commersonii TaxID=4109 RepID=A0A9J5WWR6_SOLCO|nr:hypothetical protein H5410_050870 [Solanum commersonii]